MQCLQFQAKLTSFEHAGKAFVLLRIAILKTQLCKLLLISKQHIFFPLLREPFILSSEFFDEPTAKVSEFGIAINH